MVQKSRHVVKVFCDIFLIIKSVLPSFNIHYPTLGPFKHLEALNKKGKTYIDLIYQNLLRYVNDTLFRIYTKQDISIDIFFW